tara:strand:- start:2277 stop:2756 length:480 start_codon:yes stop_codon:yes gene_type:complete
MEGEHFNELIMKDDLLNSLMVAFLGQIDSALKVSEIISSHGNEEELSPDSLITGLVYRLMIPMEDHEISSSFNQGDKIMEDIKSLLQGDEEESSDEETSLDEVIDEGLRTVTRNNCNCNVCCKARACLINYPTYEAQDDLAQKFKDAIDRSCKIHNITI